MSQLILSGCGRKGNLYPPETDKGEAQYDQSFIFPPNRTTNPLKQALKKTPNKTAKQPPKKEAQ